jgi:hypothetical protein
MTGSAGTVVDVELAAAVELVDDEEVVLASLVGAGCVAGVVASPAVVAELEPSLLHAASASAAMMKVAMCLVDFTVSQRSRCARRAGGSAQQCYRMTTESVVTPM